MMIDDLKFLTAVVCATRALTAGWRTNGRRRGGGAGPGRPRLSLPRLARCPRAGTGLPPISGCGRAWSFASRNWQLRCIRPSYQRRGTPAPTSRRPPTQTPIPPRRPPNEGPLALILDYSCAVRIDNCRRKFCKLQPTPYQRSF